VFESLALEPCGALTWGRDWLASRPDQPMMAVRVGQATLPMSVGEVDMVLGNAEGCMARLSVDEEAPCTRESHGQ
jgi:hypothetical protein